MKKPRPATGEVTVLVKGRNVTITPALHDQVVRKMQRLSKYLDRLQTIDVELCTESTRNAAQQNRVDATTHVAGRTIRVATLDAEMHAAIDQAVDKLYRQLNRQKERMKSHQGAGLAESLPVDAPDLAFPEPLDDGASAEAPAIHVERLEVKPQFEEEAIEELDSNENGFYVFLNARNEKLNVVYRREDGSYGLIEPRIG